MYFTMSHVICMGCTSVLKGTHVMMHSEAITVVVRVITLTIATCIDQILLTVVSMYF